MAPIGGLKARSPAISEIGSHWTDSTRDMNDRVPGLQVPTLVVNGEHDLSLAGGRRTADLAPDARHVVLPETGHVCNYEDPDAFNGVLRGFLTGQTRPLNFLF